MAKERSKAKKVVNVIVNVVLYTFLALLVLLFIVLFSARMNNTVPMIFGRSVLKIVSGSMEDTIPTGTYILIDDTPFEELKVGDIVTFYMRTGSLAGSPNTHRIVEIYKIDGRTALRTKGDNVKTNPVADTEPVYKEQYIGKYVTSLPVIGAVVEFFTSPLIFFLIIITPATFFIVFEIVNVVRGGKKQDKNAPALSEEELKKLAVEEYIKAHAETAAEAGTPPGSEGEAAVSSDGSPDGGDN